MCANRGDEVWLYDTNGNKFFDGYSGLWNVNLGYSNQAVKSAITQQLDELPYSNPLFFSNKIAEKLAIKLCSMINMDMTKVIFACSGSETIEVAIKLVRKYSNLRCKKANLIAVFGNSYHGSYYGSMSASTFEGNRREGYTPLLDGFVSIGIPYMRCKQSDINDDYAVTLIDQLEKTLSNYAGQICALLIEPIIGSGGVIMPPLKYMNYLQEFCTRNDVLLICDEIACGFGRSGEMFGFQNYKLRPDIVTLSKGINNGYLPAGAVCVNSRIVNCFQENEQLLFHLSTQNANPICMASCFATIEQYTDTLLENIKEMGSFWRNCLNTLLEFQCVFDIRVFGLMVAIDLIDINNDAPLSNLELNHIIEICCRRGVIVGDSFVENVLSAILLFPPYCTTKSQIRNAVSIIRQSLIEYMS